MIYKSFLQSWFRTREIFPVVPMAQRVTPSLTPQLIKGFLDKCFFFPLKIRYTDTNFCWQYWNSKWKCTSSDSNSACPPASCLLSSLLAPLAATGLRCCKVLRKAPFSFKTLGNATARVTRFCQTEWAPIDKVKLGGTAEDRRVQTSGLSSSRSETRKYIKKFTFPWTHRTVGSPQSFCGIRGRLVVFLLKDTGGPPQSRWAHQDLSASSLGCNRHSGFAMPLWGAASSRSLWTQPCPLEVSHAPLGLARSKFLFGTMQVNLLWHMKKILYVDPVMSNRDDELLPLWQRVVPGAVLDWKAVTSSPVISSVAMLVWEILKQSETPTAEGSELAGLLMLTSPGHFSALFHTHPYLAMIR